MIKKLLIIGVGGHGRCCLDIARETEEYNEIYFLDDNGVGTTVNGAEIIGNIESICEYPKEYDVFVAVGNNTLRKELICRVESLGHNVISLISQKSIVSKYATIECGSVIFPGAVVEANAVIGKGCIVTSNATVNHDAIMEEFSLVNSNTVVRPNAIIGNLAKIGSQCVITFGKKVESGSVVPDGKIV